MKKLLKTLTCALALIAGSAAFAAGGDIYEIRPCDAAGNTIAAGSINAPLSSGETFYFRMRLIGRSNADVNDAWRVNWSTTYTGAANPVQIGLYVTAQNEGSGTNPIRWAELYNIPTPKQINGVYFTDLIFKYTVKAGEFALPIRLAASASSPVTTSSSTEYYFNPNTRGAWSIVKGDGEECNLWQWVVESGRIVPYPEEDDDRQTDVTLANCGFYVKTIDFDDNWQTENTVWRTIHKNSTTPQNGLSPSVTAVSTVENAVTLYVWSDNDSVITVDGGALTNMPTNAAGSTLSTHVGKVTIYGGQTTGNFTLKAVGEEGETANIILSATPYYIISDSTYVPVGGYLTVPVTVGEALPPTLTVQATATDVTADENWTTPKASLVVDATAAYTDDVAITITPNVLGITDEDISEYVRFSKSASVSDISTLEATVDLKLKAGELESDRVYIYFLRSDAYTRGVNGISFAPTVADEAADEYFETKTSTKIRVTSVPVITVPSTYTAYAAQPTDIEIVVADAYADMVDQATGYTIEVQYPNSSYQTLEGSYYVGENYVLYEIDTDELPQLSFPSAGDDLITKIRVRAPISKKASSEVAFTANIKAARTVSVASDKDEYYEGEKAKFTFTLSEAYSAPLYAYLKPTDDTIKEKASKLFQGSFVVGAANPKGVLINTGKTEASGSLIWLDGKNSLEAELGFSVVLSTNEKWDGTADNTVVTVYSAEEIGVMVYNIEPEFKRIEMNGIEAEEDGYTFPNRIPKGMTRTFKAIVKDDGRYDLTNDEGDDRFRTRWTVRRNGSIVGDPEVKYGNPNDDAQGFVYTFNQAGTWTITAQIRDKDMDDWADATYSVNVEVLNSPYVEITPSAGDFGTYNETAKDGSIDIGLSYWDELYADELIAEVTIAPENVGEVNPGALMINTNNSDIVDYKYNESTHATTLQIRFTSTAAVRLLIKEFDGADKAFVINAKIISTTILPTSGQPANTYYLAASQATVSIANDKPVCTFVPEANSNAWEVAGGPATSYPITWWVQSDVAADFTTTNDEWTVPGIRVTISGCDNEFTTNVTRATKQKFIPDFGTAQGDREVTITIEDKDGGYQTIKYKYTITPSKFLTLIAGGPSGSTSSSTDSTKYASAAGRGEGHVYAGSTFVSATNFRLRWNCSSATSWDAYAFGYKVGDVDNGSLSGGMDSAISASGGMGSSTTGYYTYSDTTYDSFFYRWLPIEVAQTESGNNNTQATSSMIAPETKQGVSTASIKLPTKMTDDNKGYEETKYEAVFSKEYRVKDNLGDINQDGIPDIYAILTWKSGDALATAENDIKSLASNWVEGDYLPMVYAQWGNGSFDYAPGYIDACKFTAFRKLRGFHEGLNDTKYAYKSEADFSRAEALAYQAAFYKWKFEAAEGRAWTSADGFDNTDYQWTEADGYNLTSSDASVFAWSPEPETKMDLTLTDTDADDFPDGWEYFFWYQARVWAPAAQYLKAIDPETEEFKNSTQLTMFGLPREGQTYVFERFSTNNIIEGTEIPLDEVIEHFNPVAVSSGTMDFDGDGLADLEELALGTNPCHWDTDGDHMSDAWEVLMGTNALMDNRTENEDGDYMAFYNTKDLWRTTLEDGSVVFAEAGSTFELAPYKDESNAVILDDGTIGFHLPMDTVFKNVLVVMPKYLEDGTTPYLYGRVSDTNIASEVWARQMVEKPAGGWRQELTISSDCVFTKPEAATTNELILIHSQVYEAFGFDPRTAWGGESGTYLAKRWKDELDESGVAVNTVPYADYDEYLLRRYSQDMTTIPAAQKLSGRYDSEFLRFANWTTCPAKVLATNVVASVDTTATTAQAKAYQEALDSVNSTDSRKTLMSVHGADTNQDGVPDGWTLYVGANPCRGSESAVEDDDGLGFAEEFAGTDSCNAYEDCASIYMNHPGIQSGWYNKFFPTDPADPDTDGDGVSDSDEGRKWKATFQYEGKTYEGRTFSFIYGTPVDDGSRCIRGGGMNPCAVDTDHDGLPDGWERQYAGLPFQVNGSEFEFVIVTNIEDKIETVEVIEPALAQLRADGLLSTQTLAQVVTYIAGGMDATWSGDSQPSTQDNWLGRVRDLDFDHDGLANGQEYLVQQMRHFRYDDDITPLMGRVLKGAADETRAGAMRGSTTEINNIYVSMAAGRAGIAAHCEMLSPGVYSEQASAFQLTEDVWRTLGYLAPPLREWDKSAKYIMLPPAVDCTPGDKTAFDKLAEKRYVSTDPRMADTDEDGMDDYWELYHGLNPILGNVDVIAEAYNRPSSEATVGEVILIASSPLSAYYNTWTKDIVGSSMSSIDDTVVSKLLDPVLYPWMMGLPQADPDGDGLRNDEEKVLADLASPLNYHTDPSPAWFTDWTTNKSYTALYYRRTPEMKELPFWTIISGSNIDKAYYEATLPYSSLEEGSKYIVSFETTEGYDTDYDWKSDGTELARTVRQSTDPLNFADPSRRQALYLDGVNAYAKTYRVGMRKTCAVDFYKQFTVEAWVCPEEISETTEYTIVDRSSRYPSSTLAKTGNIRANFRLGVKGGKPYGLFDNSDAVETGTGEPTSCQCVVSSAMLEKGKWTHLALTYTGTTLSLYVNGELAAYAGTTLIPATGVYSIQQTAGQTAGTAKYAVYPSLFTIGARPVKTADLDNPGMQEFFKGWVDEVRVWDGARSATEVRSAYKTAFTFDEVATNREEVYTHLMSSTADSSRNDNLGKKALTPELVQHYNFTTLPSAAKPDWVITEPVGFTMNTLSQINETAKGNGVGKIGLLAQDARNQNEVYNSPYFTTWIPNTVDHLPILDGSATDTFVYSKYLSGYYILASETGVTMHNLRNSANPYEGHEVSVIDRTMRLLKLDLLQEQLPKSVTVSNVVNRYRYTIRGGFTAAGDLLACGNAYAKACPTMWDDLGASSPWEDTVADSNANGLPDWWETMYGGNFSWNDLVDYNGKQIPAWQAYLRDLAKGMQPDGSIDSTYIQTADSDGDGLVDWWKELYGLKGDANADDDGDGLSNYVEYLLSEVFDLGETFDPTVACSVNANVSDYFYRIGQMYVGEIFTDHDRISDVWEDNYATKYASRYLYDAEEDSDGDGWSNYAEFLAGTNPEEVSLRNIEGDRIPEYPVPTIEGNFVYDGTQNVEGHALIVKAFSDSRLESIPDAIWTIGGSNTNFVDHSKYLGYNSGESQTFQLPPAKIKPGSVIVKAKDLGLEVWYANANYVKEYTVSVNPNGATWEKCIYDRVHSNSDQTGDLVLEVSPAIASNVVRTVVGSINYTTGKVTIDFSLIKDTTVSLRDLTGTYTVPAEDWGYYWYLTVYNLANAHFKIEWQSKAILESGKSTYYLGEADDRSETSNSYGHVKEGKNTFIAFYDLDDNGEYTAGEPYGVALGVNVGWNTVPLTINLTDTSPVFARIKVIAGSSDSEERGTNDRTVIYGTEDDNISATALGFKEGTPSGGEKERIRVVRTAINERALFLNEQPTVLDKEVSASAEKYITEADILKDALDLDWDLLAKDINASSDLREHNITSVWYRIVMGNEILDNAAIASNNVMSVLVTRKFDSDEGYKQARPIILVSGDVKTPQPTFKWRLTNDALNTYTAFCVRIYAEDGETLVWDSDYQPMPPRVWDAKLQCHTYTWQSPLYADALLPDGSKVFENGKNYQWAIEVYNAKFNPDYNKKMTRYPSERATFFMNVLTNSVDYGQINLAVRYYGPDVVATNGKIRVQAFTSADFTGTPVAEGYVYNTADIASTNALTTNARIIGLEQGTYYIRAFIDTKTPSQEKFDGQFAAWKSWGIVCNRDDKLAKIYVPKPVTISSRVGISPTIPLYIEDCDTDHDMLPDAWEMQTKGNLTSLTTSSLDQVLPGGFAMQESLTKKINASGTLPSGLAAIMRTSLSSPYVAAFLMDVSSDPDTAVAALATASAGLDAEESSIAITKIVVDSEKNEVVLDYATDLQAASETVASRIYSFDTKNLNLVLWRTDSLGEDANWYRACDPISLDFGTGSGSVSVALPEDQDLTSGFYKVTVEKAN